MDEKEFKKLLIDLDTSATEISREVGISVWGVIRYFRGELRNPKRREQIKRALQTRAEKLGIELPEFWEEAA